MMAFIRRGLGDGNVCSWWDVGCFAAQAGGATASILTGKDNTQLQAALASADFNQNPADNAPPGTPAWWTGPLMLWVAGGVALMLYLRK